MDKKMTVILSFIGILILGGGIWTYFSHNQKSETAQSSVFISEKNQVKSTSTETKKENETSKKTSENKAEDSEKLKKQTLSKVKEVQAFNTAVLAQDYYLEKVENGQLSYEKATEEGLKRLEKQAGDKNLSHYQVLHDGQMISVLTGNEEGTDT